MWCWRRLLRLSWTRRRPIQSILKEINPEYSLEGLMLELKLQYFDHLMKRANSMERPRCSERLEGRRRRGNRGLDGWMASPTQWTWVCANSGRQWRTAKPGMLQSMGSQTVRDDLATEQGTRGNWDSISCEARQKKKGIWGLSQIPVLPIVMLHKLMSVLNLQCSKTI